MAKGKFRRVGKPTSISEGPTGSWTFELQPVETDAGFEIEWSAVDLSAMLDRWRRYWGNYKRRNKRFYCLTAAEARAVIKGFVQKMAELEKDKTP